MRRMRSFSVRLLRSAALLLLGAMWLAPVAASANDEMASGDCLTAIGVQGDDCCPSSARVTPPCEDASLCAARAVRGHFASSIVQATPTGFVPAFWTRAADPRDG